MYVTQSTTEISLEEADKKWGGGPDTVYVFDFDGVLVEQSEDVLYRLADDGTERATLEKLALTMKIDPSLYATNYLRHLVLQGVMLRRKVPSLPGPLMKMAKQLGSRPFFISDGAIRRGRRDAGRQDLCVTTGSSRKRRSTSGASLSRTS
jgi:hypothetical protein